MEQQGKIYKTGNFELGFAIAVLLITVSVLLFCVFTDTKATPIKIEQTEKF